MIKIIGGKYKNKKLFLPKDKLTRPLKNNVKESIFNLINHSVKIFTKIENSNILDLFSGTGSFGLECISRRAKKVFFVESHNEALEILKKNIDSFKNPINYELIKTDCFDYLDKISKFNQKFDVIFIDPPYKEKRLNNLVKLIINKKTLTKNGIVILHRHKKDQLVITDEFKIIDVRIYGISKIIFGN